jgi:hypothetical protein
MANDVTSKPLPATRQIVTVRTGAGMGRGSKVKFGSVTISGTKPSAAVVKTNVERSTKALERVTRTLAKPGVVIRAKKDVPQFSVAEGETGIFVRKLNGRTERGRLVDGTFRVLD